MLTQFPEMVRCAGASTLVAVAAPSRDRRPVKLVTEPVRGFKEILEGKHDDVTEGNFYMKGAIEEIREG